MRASDIMTTKVVTISPDLKVDEIARVLLEKGISAVPVADENGKVLGIVSEGDLLRRHENHTERRHSSWLSLFTSSEDEARDYAKTHGMTAAQVMTDKIISVDEETLVGDIAQLLEKRRIKRVPVIQDGKLVGIVSRANLLHGLAASKDAGPAAPSVDDRQLRKNILAKLENENWISHGALNVIVTSGAVELWGWVNSEDERKALMIAVETVEGVTSVEDHLGMVAPWVQGA
ncbi:MAG: CBS domain-containing protein [Alphaproteobacteria bacterium]|jgi:CBS domain-containing protein|nr:CBS domain-containing protein [Alphaproteobacteria bacterium]MBT4082409.1 CBS domain-containing protein [Alphaproteobacteria bacterium]MBT4545951.1 CBS domain-containing protein [Alphaproteobacteria bacterium]MBT7744968.1 CBS domain-containing protein [Alphaproteobacteria bacterium]